MSDKQDLLEHAPDGYTLMPPKAGEVYWMHTARTTDFIEILGPSFKLHDPATVQFFAWAAYTSDLAQFAFPWDAISWIIVPGAGETLTVRSLPHGELTLVRWLRYVRYKMVVPVGKMAPKDHAKAVFSGHVFR